MNTNNLRKLKRFSNSLLLCVIFFVTLTNIKVFAQPVNAIHLDGSDDYVDCGNAAAVQITGSAITLEAWVYASSMPSFSFEGNVINKEYNFSDDGYMLRVGEDRVNFNLGNGSWHEINSTIGSFTINTWYHLAGTYDGTTMRLYINGTEVGTRTTLTGNITDALNIDLHLGNGDFWDTRLFNGKIEEVRIWDIARTATQINDNMNVELCLPQPGLRAYYQFNQNTANSNNSGMTNVIDLLGSSNGTLINSSLNGSSSNWVDGQTLGPCITVSLEHLDIYSECDGENNLLKWEIDANENEIQKYIIQKSFDGKLFDDIDILKSTYQSENKWVDDNADLAYYRVKTINNHEEEFMSEIVKSGCNALGFKLVSVSYLNNKLNVSMNSIKDQSIELSIVDINGKFIQNEKFELTKGINIVHIENNISKGLYYVRITDGLNIDGLKYFNQ